MLASVDETIAEALGPKCMDAIHRAGWEKHGQEMRLSGARDASSMLSFAEYAIDVLDRLGLGRDVTAMQRRELTARTAMLEAALESLGIERGHIGWHLDRVQRERRDSERHGNRTTRT